MTLINKPEKYNEMSQIKNPFGNGDSSEKIFEEILKFLKV